MAQSDDFRATTPSEKLAVWKSIVARVHDDSTQLAALKANPNQYLADNKITPSPGVNYVVVEDTTTTRHLVLPPKTADLNPEEAAGQPPDPGF